MTSTRRPLYLRLLGVRHLHPRPLTVFLLFEGSIALGVLLALADLVSPWGALAVPVAVAVMVKVNDRVARALTQPLALVQLAATPRLRDYPSVGSAVARPSRWTGEIAGDDAVASPEAHPDARGPGEVERPRPAIGVASVPNQLPPPRPPWPAAPTASQPPAATGDPRQDPDWPGRANTGHFGARPTAGGPDTTTPPGTAGRR